MYFGVWQRGKAPPEIMLYLSRFLIRVKLESLLLVSFFHLVRGCIGVQSQDLIVVTLRHCAVQVVSARHHRTLKNVVLLELVQTCS